MPEMIVVQHPSGRYTIDTSVGGLETLAARIDALAPGGRLHIVTDSTVRDLYGDDLHRALVSRRRTASIQSFPAGEASKSLDTIRSLWDTLLAQDIDRGDTVVAFGGGVVGDIAGFVASTVLRGINVLQIPTTLLAMADAAIGGKTGINHATGKNLIGSFHQPAAVLAWLPSLRTLADRELRSGLSEVAKSAIIAGEAEVRLLERLAPELANRSDDALREVVWMAAQAKAEIVSADAEESGIRRILNFGHTFAHAIEHASGYGSWTHGEAVAVGIQLACRFSSEYGYCDSSVAERVRTLFERLNLPSSPPSLTVEQWMQPISRDKKRHGSDVRLVLCRGMGACVTESVPLNQLCDWLTQVS